MFYVSRMPHPSIIKTDRQVVLMSSMMERDGLTITRKIFSAMRDGIVVYNYDLTQRTGELYQWCGVCGCYKTQEDFHIKIDGRQMVCRECINSKKRARKYSQDVGLVHLSDNGQYDDIVIEAPDDVVEKMKFANGKYKIVKVEGEE